jgi:hypothetical protein
MFVEMRVSGRALSISCVAFAVAAGTARRRRAGEVAHFWRATMLPASIVHSERDDVKINPARYYCYLSGSWLLALLEGDKERHPVLDALLDVLKVPGKPAQLRRYSHVEKFALIEEHIEHLRKIASSLWHRVEAPEILAAHLYIAKMSKKARAFLFSAVADEADLTDPVVAWVKEHGMQPHAQVSTGTKIPDVVGHRPGGWLSSDRIVAIELKNDLG